MIYVHVEVNRSDRRFGFSLPIKTGPIKGHSNSLTNRATAPKKKLDQRKTGKINIEDVGRVDDGGHRGS